MKDNAKWRSDRQFCVYSASSVKRDIHFVLELTTCLSHPSRPYVSPSLFAVLLIVAFLFRSPRFVTTSQTRRFTLKKSCTISRASSNQASLGDTLKPTSPSRRAQSPNLSRTPSVAWQGKGAWACPGVRLPWKALSRIRRVDVIVTSVHDVGKKHSLT